MQNQRIRNLTTGKLHTKMEDIYHDIEFITGEEGVMTHMLPNACRAMQDWLKAKLPEPRFWDGQYDTTHEGETELVPMNAAEQSEFWQRFGELPSLLSLIGTSRE